MTINLRGPYPVIRIRRFSLARTGMGEWCAAWHYQRDGQRRARAGFAPDPFRAMLRLITPTR